VREAVRASEVSPSPRRADVLCLLQPMLTLPDRGCLPLGLTGPMAKLAKLGTAK
jgi:hypothetical protein